MSDLQLRVEETFGSVEGMSEEWDQIAARHGGSIYSSFSWSKTWWEVYGAGRQLRIFLFFAGDRLVSVLPLYIDRVGIWPFRLSVCRLVCASIPPKAFNPPVDPSLAPEIFKRVVRRLMETDGCDVLSYGPVSESHGALTALRGLAESVPELVSSAEPVTSGVHSVFQLPATLDLFLDQLDKDERKKRKYENRLLRREHAVSEDILTIPAQAEGEFEEFAESHAQQWQEKKKAGHFGSWPKGLEFNRALVRALAPLDRVRFVRILVDGQAISSQYVFSFANCYFWELPARRTGREWQRYSLGPAGFLSVVDAATKEGKTIIEGGLAHYEYKQKLNAIEIPVHTVHVIANRLWSKLLVRMFAGIRYCLMIAYHKVWYQRIVPRLPPVFTRPQWSLWLRLDF